MQQLIKFDILKSTCMCDKTQDYYSYSSKYGRNLESTHRHIPILFLDCEFEQSKINGMVLCVKCVASEFGLEKSVSLFNVKFFKA